MSIPSPKCRADGDTCRYRIALPIVVEICSIRILHFLSLDFGRKDCTVPCKARPIGTADIGTPSTAEIPAAAFRLIGCFKVKETLRERYYIHNLCINLWKPSNCQDYTLCVVSILSSQKKNKAVSNAS